MFEHDFYSLYEAGGHIGGEQSTGSKTIKAREEVIKDLIYLAAKGEVRFIVLIPSDLQGMEYDNNGRELSRDWKKIKDSYCLVPQDTVKRYEAVYAVHGSIYLDKIIRPNDSGGYWGLSTNQYESVRIIMTPQTLHIFTKDVNHYRDKRAKTVTSATEHLPEEIKTLIRAYNLFWKNADPEQKDTHPNNQQVIDWLKKEGLTDNLAKPGATIIRPGWAAKGRRPEE
jgi:hypothetical protein